MKVVLFTHRGSDAPEPGLLTDRGVVGVGDLVAAGDTPQEMMENLINDFDEIRLALERRTGAATALATGEVQLLPPLPAPGKILCTLDESAESGSEEKLRMYLKDPDGVLGSGDTVEFTEPSGGVRAEAKLGMVVKGPAHSVTRQAWHTVVFGFLCVVDLIRPPDPVWGISWQRSFDTPCAIGTYVVTADEIANPEVLAASIGERGGGCAALRADRVGTGFADVVELATSVMTLHTGDLLVSGGGARFESEEREKDLRAVIGPTGECSVNVHLTGMQS